MWETETNIVAQQLKPNNQLKADLEALAAKQQATLLTGAAPTWAENHVAPNQQKIQAAKAKALASKEDRKKEMRTYLQDGEQNKILGRKITDLLKDWQEGGNKQNVIKTAINQFEDFIKPKNVTSSEMGLSYQDRLYADRQLNQAINELATEKMGYLVSSGNLDTLLKAAGISKNSLSHRKLKELILLDDWDELAPMAEQAIYTGGPEALDILYDRYVRNTGASLLPYSKSGLSITDYSSNFTSEPSKTTRIPGHTTRHELLKTMTSYEFLTPDSVSKDYLASVVCPERFTYRNPVIFPKRTALVSGSTGFILRSDANGNTGFYINPQNPAVATADLSTAAFFAVHDFTEFVPQTGAWTDATQVDPPLRAQRSNFLFFRRCSCAVTVTPLQSQLNAAGNFQFAYFDIFGGGKPVVPQQGLMQNSYYQTGNGMSTFRMIDLPIDNQPYMAWRELNSEFSGGMYGILTGCQPETNIAKVEIHYNYEIIPTATQTQFSVTDLPTPGVRTADFLSNLLQVLPGLQALSFEEALTLATRVRNAPPDYDALFEVIFNYIIEHVPSLARASGLSKRSQY